MRSRNEIEKDIAPMVSGNLTVGLDTAPRVTIELLLDIRDLLQNPPATQGRLNNTRPVIGDQTPL